MDVEPRPFLQRDPGCGSRPGGCSGPALARGVGVVGSGHAPAADVVVDSSSMPAYRLQGASERSRFRHKKLGVNTCTSFCSQMLFESSLLNPLSIAGTWGMLAVLESGGAQDVTRAEAGDQEGRVRPVGL